MSETESSFPNAFLRMKFELQQPGSPATEGTMTVWLSGSRFRVLEETDDGTTEMFGDLESDRGLIQTPDGETRPINATTIAHLGNQVLVDEDEDELEQTGTVERFGRECSEVRGTRSREDQDGSTQDINFHQIVSPPYIFFHEGRAVTGPGYYKREVYEFSEGTVTDEDFIPPGEDAPIGPVTGTFVHVLVAEDGEYAPWLELEDEVERLLLRDAPLDSLSLTVGDLKLTQPEVTYFTNVGALSIQMPSKAEEVDEVVDELALVLAATERELEKSGKSPGSFLSPEVAEELEGTPPALKLEARNADLADTLDVRAAHESARALLSEDWIWDEEDELTPFGSDEAAVVITQFAALERDHSLSSACQCLDEVIAGELGEAPAADYWKQETLPTVEEEGDEWDEAIAIDEMVIAAAVAQFAIQGRLDPDLHQRARLSLGRQLELDVPEQWKERVSHLRDLLEKAPAGA